MHQSKIKQISLAMCLTFMPFTGYALDLGKFNLNSGLGEPLKATIELLSATPEELSSLDAVIVSEEAYDAQGITGTGIHNNVKVEIAKNPDGLPILTLSSFKPISNHYLDMLIQADWAAGRLQHKYTVSLDTPENNQSDNSVTATPVTHVTTKRGDNLSSVASDLRVEGVSLDQMIVGLYESNKLAFLNHNMNHLKVGQIIKVPTKKGLTSINAQQARQSIKVHSTYWNAYRNTTAGIVENAPALVDTEQKQSGAGKTATAEDKTRPAKVRPQKIVKLSASENEISKTVKDVRKAFNAKIVALHEEILAHEKSLKKAKERNAFLEKQIQDVQKLLTLKSQSKSQLQKNAVTASEAPDVKTESEALAKTQDAPKGTPPEPQSEPGFLKD